MVMLAELIGESPALSAVRAQIEQLLRRQSGTRRLPPVLIAGETGTGKGLLARAIHNAGPRSGGPFIAVNCAAIPEALLEAELFGFEQGAFTDARRPKAGLFQVAHRGTLFLDEVGLLPQSLQAKLLTALEDRVIRRLGGTRTEAVDIWIITATSEDLKAGTRKARFREDLFHRLAVVTLRLPPLRERGRDILVLAEHFLARACSEYGLAPKELADDARAGLLAHRWPGNVRELANLMERVALLVEGKRVTAARLELEAAAGRPPSPPSAHQALSSGGAERMPLAQTVERLERGRIFEALHETQGNVSQAANRLGVTRNILRYRLHKYGLRVSAETDAPATRRSSTEPPSPVVEHAAAQTPFPVRWERRHLALLLVDAGTALEPVVEKIYSFGGEVEEISPRGLVAVFGLRLFDDAARRAAHAALTIQKLAGHVGLHVGEMLVARVGSVLRVDREAKRAAWLALERFMQSVAAGTVLVTGMAHPFLARRFVLEPLSDGDDADEPMYRLAGLEPTGLGPVRDLTPFVARAHELEQLARALECAAQGQGRIVAVAADAGVGKSRLLREFITSRCVQSSLVLMSGAAPYAAGMPYAPVIDLLKAYFAIERHDDESRIRARVTERVLSLGRALASAVPALLALLDVPHGDAGWETAEPQEKRRRILEAVKLLLVEESRRQPVIAVIEDLHWIDSETQAVLQTLAESLPSQRLLLVVSYRLEYQHPWGGHSHYALVQLTPLSPQDAHDLLECLVGRDVTTAPLRQELVERTGGNPFFLEESVRTLVETGVLGGDRGAYRVARPPEKISVPDTVQAVLAARIERLVPEDRTLLQTAAAIGRDVPLTLLRAVADVAEEDLRTGLTRLQRSELIYETRLVPDAEYSFQHPLSHEVAYATLLEDRRRSFHVRIVEAVERLYADRMGEQIDRLAYHAFRGQMWDKAVSYSRQAGAKAAGRSAHREAVGCYEQALGALAHLPDSPRRMEEAIDLRCDLRISLLLLAQFARGLDNLREAQALAEALGDDRRLGWVCFYLIASFRVTGDNARAIDAGRRALLVAEKVGDSALQAATSTQLGIVYGTLGRYREAVDILRCNVECLAGPRRYEGFRVTAGLPVVLGHGFLAWYLAELGEFEEARARAAEGLRIAESVDDSYTLAHASTMVGLPALLQGNPAQGIPTVERALDLCRSMSFHNLFPSTASCLGALYSLAGRSGEAIALLEEAVRAAGSMDRKDRCAIFFARLGEAHLRAGGVENAARAAAQALQLAREQGERGHEVYALRLLGELGAEGESSYVQALTLARELGMRPLIAHCHLGLGRLYRRGGNGANAEHQLRTAAAFYRELDMPFWLAQA